MYKIVITSSIGVVTIYLDNLLNINDELNKYPDIESVTAEKTLKK